MIQHNNFNQLPFFEYFVQKNATIIGHQGFSDFFSQNAIYNKFINKYDNVIIFVLDESRKMMVEYMFKDKKNVKIVLPQIHYNYNKIDTCLNCISFGNPNYCPRTHNIKCSFIDYSKYDGYINIKLAGFDDYKKWNEFYTNSNQSFSHCFYLYHSIDLTERINKFNIYRDNELENKKYQEYTNLIENKKYIVIHDILNHKINAKYLNNCYSIYKLENVSNIFADQLSIIENAEEVHIIDSSYACLLYFMCLKYDFMKDKKIYLHIYARPNRDTRIYENPQPNNWIFLINNND